MFGQALVMGKLNYYLPLLSAERSTGVLRCLDVALNKLMRVLTGLIKTTPIPLLHYFSKIPPLDVLIQEASMRTFRRINLNSDSLLEADYSSWDGSKMGMTPFDGLYMTNVMMQNTFPELSQLDDVDSELLESAYWVQYECLKSRDMAMLTHQKGRLLPKVDISIYTDGSLKLDAHSRSASAGWTIQLEDSEIDSGCCHITPATSSYLCEMVGLHQAMSRLIQMSEDGHLELNNKSIAVLSDSRSAITHLRSTSLSNKKLDHETINILEVIHELRQHGVRSLQMVWIPGHMNIAGNERADELADEGHECDERVDLGTPPTAIRSWIKKQKLKMMNRYLYEHVRDSRIHPDAPPRLTMKLNLKYPIEIKQPSRRSTVSLNRLRSGHLMCGLSSSRIFDDADKLCRWCELTSESYEHVLMECPAVLSLDHKYRNRILEFEMELKYVIVSTKKCHQSAVMDLLNVLEKNGVTF